MANYCTLKNITKGCSIIGGIMIIVLIIQRFSQMEVSEDFIITFYYIVLAAILILAEFNVDLIFSNFRLLENFFGRGIYCIFYGTLVISDKPLYQLIVSVILIIGGILYIILYFIDTKQGGDGGKATPSKDQKYIDKQQQQPQQEQQPEVQSDAGQPEQNL